MQKYVVPFSSTATTSFPNGTQIVTPFSGEATQWINDGGSFRAPRLPAQRDTMPVLDNALEEMGFVEQETIHLDATSLPPGANEALRSPYASEQVVLQPAAAGDGAPQLVLYADEAGGLTWHLPDDFGAERTGSAIMDAKTVRSSRRRTFTIATRTAAARQGLDSGQVQMRGIITAIGRKVLKVFVIPLVAKVMEKPIENIVGPVERRHSQNLIRGVNAINFQQRVNTPFSDWQSLATQRTLLIVHGIISSTEGMLSKLPANAMSALTSQYGGRVIGYDHFTLSADPDQNAVFFLKQVKQALPNDTLNLDILCHSRGGIVSRALVERGRALLPEHNCNFGKVFFVATPNAGSALGDAAHVVDMVDVFTNLLTKLPDGPAAYVIESVLAVLKLLVYSTETALPGLADMGTQGYIRKTLNVDGSPLPGVVYGAAAANYDPDPDSPRAFFAAALNAIVDRTFAVDGQPVGNDLVVPCDGVHAANGSPMFPIADPLVYGPTDFVYHNDFFAQRRTVDKIKDFFSSPAPDDPAGFRLPTSSRPGITEVGGRVGFGGSGGSRRSGSGGKGSGWGAPQSPGGATDFTRFDRIDQLESYRGSYGEPSGTKSADFGEGAGGGGEDGGSIGEAGDESPHAPAQPKFAGPLASTDPEGALPEVELTRKPEIIFHEQVTAGEPNELTVTLNELTQQDPDTVTQLEFALAAGQPSVTVNVLLSATGFDIRPDSATMTVARQRDEEKERAKFTLTARDVEKPLLRAIHADFMLGTSIIGAVTHYTCVVPKNYSGPGLPCQPQSVRPQQGFAVPRKARRECDWVLVIKGDAPEYKVSLTSRLPEATFESRDTGVLKIQEKDMAKYLNDILAEQFGSLPRFVKGIDPEDFKRQIAAWKENFMDIIGSLGKRLWQWLPPELQAEYFKQYRAGSSPASILIHSEEMIFPWELLIPNDSNGTILKPLGVAHVLGRWKPGLTTKPKEQMLKVRRFRVLNPNYAKPDKLEWATEEAAKLQLLFPNLVSPVKPADLPAVLKLFQEPDVQVLHFSGHGDVNLSNPDLNKILLENSTEFKALQLSGTALCTIAQPVVYMNACSVGNMGDTVGRAGGFASNFVTNGCSGVIAPLWPINDKTSMQFALALYGKLKLGRAVGEALQELRDGNPSDPTYCAYTYFGDPWVRLNLGKS
jgi:hypothetical protein